MTDRVGVNEGRTAGEVMLPGGVSRPSGLTRLERFLQTSRAAHAADPVVVFAVALAAITFARPLVGDHPLARQAVVWVANLVMLAVVWLGLRLRGQGWEHLGLQRRFAGCVRLAAPC